MNPHKRYQANSVVSCGDEGDEGAILFNPDTAGSLNTEETLAAFGVGKRRMRLDSIQVSIDGSCAAIHDRSRPPVSFERAMRSLRLLKASGFPVTVRVTINRHNVDDLPAIARLLLEEVGRRGACQALILWEV